MGYNTLQIFTQEAIHNVLLAKDEFISKLHLQQGGIDICRACGLFKKTSQVVARFKETRNLHKNVEPVFTCFCKQKLRSKIKSPADKKPLGQLLVSPKVLHISINVYQRNIVPMGYKLLKIFRS